MAFFIQMISYWILLWLLSHFKALSILKSHALKGRIAFSISFTVVGLMHLISPGSMVYMIEHFIPYARIVVLATGIMEIVLAVGLLIPRYQRITGWLIIVYLIAIFPANINVAINNLPAPGGLPSEPWYVWSRLLFQPLYILWVYLAALKLSRWKRLFDRKRRVPA